MNRYTHILLLTSLATLLVGCQNPSQPSKQADIIEGARKPAPALIMLIENPKVMREDVKYPSDSVKQVLYWQNHYAEWRFSLPVKGYSYAGFRFFIPYNLSQHIDKYDLVFTITPASKSRYLWVGLVDGDDQPGNMLIELPLKEYARQSRGSGRTEIRIPISRFPRTGIPAQLDSGMEDSMSGDFDWQDVRGIRLINPGGRLPPGDIVITDLRFAR